MKELAKLGVDISDASMCWIQEPNEKNYRLVVHDEYCYEMGALNPVPAYTLQDLIIKLKGEVSRFDPEILSEYTCIKDTPWMFRILPLVNDALQEEVYELGETPLQAAYCVIIKVCKKVPSCIGKLPHHKAKYLSPTA